MKLQRRNSAGQALVLVLLFLAVVLTLVLYILSRTVTGVAISTGNEDSVRAFSAAEAGIEKALVMGAGGTNVAIGDSSYTSSVKDVAKGSNLFPYPFPLNSGDTATVWFVAHDQVTSGIVCNASNPCFTGQWVRVCWGNLGTSGVLPTTPAIEFSVFYESIPGNISSTKIARIVLDPYDARAVTNKFSSVVVPYCTVGGEFYAFGKNIDLSTLGIPPGVYTAQNGLLFGRLRILYNTDMAHKVGFGVGFAGNSLLPSQGYLIDSIGKAGVSNRRISVFQSWPEPPAIFDFAIYSSAGLTK